jgi:hypothetical protein
LLPIGPLFTRTSLPRLEVLFETLGSELHVMWVVDLVFPAPQPAPKASPIPVGALVEVLGDFEDGASALFLDAQPAGLNRPARKLALKQSEPFQSIKIGCDLVEGLIGLGGGLEDTNLSGRCLGGGRKPGLPGDVARSGTSR